MKDIDKDEDGDDYGEMSSELDLLPINPFITPDK
jgi:hypothetical protein